MISRKLKTFQNFVFDIERDRDRQTERERKSHLNENLCPSIHSSLYLCIFINSLEFIGGVVYLVKCTPLTPLVAPFNYDTNQTFILSDPRKDLHLLLPFFFEGDEGGEDGTGLEPREGLKGVRSSSQAFLSFLFFFIIIIIFYFDGNISRVSASIFSPRFSFLPLSPSYIDYISE